MAVVMNGAPDVSDMDVLIDVVNAALEMGDWAQVSMATVPLYSAAVAAGESEFAELVQDLHWIANDALVHPLEVAGLVQP